MSEQLTDSELIGKIQTRGEEGMKILYTQYYNYMCHAVYRIIPDAVLVEDIVQDVFYEVWKKRDNLSIQLSLKAYLRRASVNKALNYIRDQKIKFDDEERIPELQLSTKRGGQQEMELDELQTIVHNAIDQLPKRCRIIFSMSRFEDMSYREIAQSLDISIKTVENQMSKALKILREIVYPYLGRK